MGWSSTNPGGSYTKKYGTIKTANYYSLKYELYVARLTNNNISVKVVCTPMGKGSTSQGPYYPAYQYFNTGSDSVFMAGESTNTKYWTGTLNAGSTKRFNLGYSNSKPTMDGQVFFEWDVTGPAYTTQYSITYNANGGSGSMGATVFTYGGSATVSYNGFNAPAGHHFVGWKDGGGTWYTAGSAYTLWGNLTLYAQWAADTYTIKYNANGGSGTAPANQSKTYNVAVNLRSNTFSYTGYNFLHWNTKADNTGTSYAAGASFNGNGSGNGATINLYAIWSIRTFTITYKSNYSGGPADQTQSKNYGATATIKPASTFSRTKYVFITWNTNSSGAGTDYPPGSSYRGDANLTLYAIWKKANIPVFYKLSGSVRQAEKTYVKVNGTVYPATLYVKKDGQVYEVT